MAATTASVVEAATSATTAKKMKGAMSNLFGVARSHERWARFRFSVIGSLLAAPPERGELQEQLKSLAAKKWHHPITGQRVQFGLSTIERWFYTARNAHAVDRSIVLAPGPPSIASRPGRSAAMRASMSMLCGIWIFITVRCVSYSIKAVGFIH